MLSETFAMLVSDPGCVHCAVEANNRINVAVWTECGFTA